MFFIYLSYEIPHSNEKLSEIADSLLCNNIQDMLWLEVPQDTHKHKTRVFSLPP